MPWKKKLSQSEGKAMELLLTGGGQERPMPMAKVMLEQTL